jgi:predicted cobalt transporter CbtA
MHQPDRPRLDAPTLLAAFAAVSLAADAAWVATQPAAHGLGLLIIAKYPAAMVLGALLVRARCFVRYAAERCAEDLHD